MIKIVQVFLGADMRCSHHGLAELAKQNKIDVHNLEQGEFVLFVNNEKNKLKLYATNNIIAYLALEKGHIDMRTIALIPKSFTASGRIEYDKALRTVLERELVRKSLRD